MVQNILYIVIC